MRRRKITLRIQRKRKIHFRGSSRCLTTAKGFDCTDPRKQFTLRLLKCRENLQKLHVRISFYFPRSFLRIDLNFPSSGDAPVKIFGFHTARDLLLKLSEYQLSNVCPWTRNIEIFRVWNDFYFKFRFVVARPFAALGLKKRPLKIKSLKIRENDDFQVDSRHEAWLLASNFRWTQLSSPNFHIQYLRFLSFKETNRKKEFENEKMYDLNVMTFDWRSKVPTDNLNSNFSRYRKRLN